MKERERERERGMDKENKIGLFYYGCNNEKQLCKPSPLGQCFLFATRHTPSWWKNALEFCQPCPQGAGSSQNRCRTGEPSIPQDKDAQGKQESLSLCRAHAICLANTREKVTLFFLT